MDGTRETLGKIASHLQIKSPETRDPQELQKAQAADYQRVILDVCNAGKKIYPRDFFVVSLCKKEELFPNVFRNLIHHRTSCPTPTYDQTVYHYSRKENSLFFVWTLPDHQTCLTFKENALQIVPDEKWLRDIIIDFYEGNLDKLCDKLNGKKSDIILYRKEEGSNEHLPPKRSKRIRRTSRSS